MDLAVIGTGHVGVVTAAGFGAVGHDVRAYDVDAQRIRSLRSFDVPFFEPGIAALLAPHKGWGTVTFDEDPTAALAMADVIFLCVGTESRRDGGTDLAPLRSAARLAATHSRTGAVVVIRSTAPPGTAELISDVMAGEGRRDLSVAVNPEFMAEGTAVRDFLAPDRIVVGAAEDRAAHLLRRAYDPIILRRLPEGLPDVVYERAAAGPHSVPFVVAPTVTAELSKYASNAFLAVKISFVNEIAMLAEEVGADVTEISRILGLDRRIGGEFLRAGIGWGGSCLPKDVRAIDRLARVRGLPPGMLHAAAEVNRRQHAWVLRKLRTHLVPIQDSTIALLGLAFKAGTDDIRNAPAVEIANLLVQSGAMLRAFDPVTPELPPSLRDAVNLLPDPVDAARDADALVVLTDWDEFQLLDLAELRRVMRGSLLLDGRNVVDPRAARMARFRYVGVGRGDVAVRQGATLTARS